MECIKIEKNPMVKGNLTVLELMAEMDNLKKENEDLRIENIELRIDNELLHNMMANRTELEILKNEDNEGGWSEEETVLMAQMYAEAEKDFKF